MNRAVVKKPKGTSPKSKSCFFMYVLGCGKLYVLDGNWKLCYSHCMYPVPVTISGYEKEINYPAVCPRNPKYGLAFCDQHFSVVERKGVPTKLKPFLEYCNKKNKGNFSELM